MARAISSRTVRATNAYRLECKYGSRSQPNRLGVRMLMPEVPPVHLELLRTTAYTATPKPSVTTARVMPRVRRAVNPTATPATAIAIAATMITTRNGRCAESRAATRAPVPASTYCASESWPA